MSFPDLYFNRLIKPYSLWKIQLFNNKRKTLSTPTISGKWTGLTGAFTHFLSANLSYNFKEDEEGCRLMLKRDFVLCKP